MKVQNALEELTKFKEELEKELEKLKDTDDLEYDKQNSEEEFIYTNLRSVISDLEYAAESIGYINKPIAQEGIVNTKGGKFYIADFELSDGDCIECFIDGYWEKVDIFKIKGEFFAEHLTEKVKTISIKGRIRLTPDELNDRKEAE